MLGVKFEVVGLKVLEKISGSEMVTFLTQVILKYKNRSIGFGNSPGSRYVLSLKLIDQRVLEEFGVKCPETPSQEMTHDFLTSMNGSVNLKSQNDYFNM